MSIAEKLLTIAENEQRVYESGQSSMVDESKIIEKTASGIGYVTVNDVSEIPHDVSVKLTNKNLFDGQFINGAHLYATGEYSKSAKYITTKNKIPVAPNSAYILSAVFGEGKCDGAVAYDKDGAYISKITVKNAGNVTFTTPSNTQYITFNIYGENISVEGVSNCQLELGTTATEYTPYIEDFSAVKVQRLGKNLCPNNWEIGALDVNNGKNKSDANMVRTKDYFTLDKFKVYYISANNLDSTVGITWYFYDKDENFIKRIVSYQDRSISVSGAIVPIPEDTVFYRLVVNTNDVNIKVQIELGTTATEYEPYKEPITYTANADGTVKGITSLSPNMALQSDGFNIEMTYHKSWGMQTEYDRFWDSFQSNGNRNNYRFAFYSWNDATYKPKYPINAQNQCVDTYYYAKITDTLVDITIGAESTRFFSNANQLVTIRKLIVSEKVTYTNCFVACNALTNITFEGVIGQDISFSDCPLLSKASIQSIISHLSDTETGRTLTLKTTAVNSAFGSSTSTEWLNLIATKPNWKIILA